MKNEPQTIQQQGREIEISRKDGSDACKLGESEGCEGRKKVKEGKTRPTVKSGDRFLNLTVICRDHQTKSGRWKWKCACDCGQVFIKAGNQLKSNRKGYCFACCNHPNQKHGKKHSAIYTVWRGMMDRCLNKSSTNYHRYGGRGILICDKWKEFQNFYADMGDPPFKGSQIDRVNNNLGYYLENCRWATRSQNQRNRSNSRVWIRDGVEYPTLESMAAAHSVSIQTVHRWCVGGCDKRRNQTFKPKTNCGSKKLYENS